MVAAFLYIVNGYEPNRRNKVKCHGAAPLRAYGGPSRPYFAFFASLWFNSIEEQRGWVCKGEPWSRGGAWMTITLDLEPDLEQRVLAQAAAQGVSPEAYLLTIIGEAVLPCAPEVTTLEQFEAALDAFSEGTEALPVLPPEAFTRESIYEGR